MPCFCHFPADLTRTKWNVGITPVLPPPPQLKLIAALPALDPAERADIKINSGFEQMRLPNVDLGGGPLAQIAMTLSLAAGNFKIDNLPMLEAQMQQAADSFSRNIWPRLSFMTKFKMQPLLNMALVARLMLDLKDLGIDPLTVKAGFLAIPWIALVAYSSPEPARWPMVAYAMALGALGDWAAAATTVALLAAGARRLRLHASTRLLLAAGLILICPVFVGEPAPLFSYGGSAVFAFMLTAALGAHGGLRGAAA